MSLSALAPSTIRALGASQSIVDPTTVIKELIDNALDAGATCISIETSGNTLDAVTVKDNGLGIPPVDRPLVAKRYYTNKIANEEDLKHIRGKTLGFRGEALSHIAEISRFLSVTTRVDGESTASCITFARDGSIKEHGRASQVVGTTIIAKGLFEYHPVRKQNLLKVTAKTISSLQVLIKAYAFARPSVRLSFRISRSEKCRLGIASSTGSSLYEHSLKIMGKKITAQSREAEFQSDDLSIKALLPHRECLRFEGEAPVAAFVSIDGRPLTTARGLGKRLIKAVNDHLNPGNETSHYKAGLICLNIQTKNLSYDVNIEPTKDDIFMHDTNHVQEALKGMLVELDAIGPITGIGQESTAFGISDAVTDDKQRRANVIAIPTKRPRTPDSLYDDEATTPGPRLRLRPGQETEKVDGGTDVHAFNSGLLAPLDVPHKPDVQVSHLPTPSPERESSILPIDGVAKGSPSLSSPPRHFRLRASHTSMALPDQASPLRPYASDAAVNTRSEGEASGTFPPVSSFTPINVLPEGPSLSTPSDARSSYPLPQPPSTDVSVRQSNGRTLDMIPLASRPARKWQGSQKRQKGNPRKPFKPPMQWNRDSERDAWFDVPQMRRDEHVLMQERTLREQSQSSLVPAFPVESPNNTSNASDCRDIRSFMRPRDPTTSTVEQGYRPLRTIPTSEATEGKTGSQKPAFQRPALLQPSRTQESSSAVAQHSSTGPQPLVERDVNTPPDPRRMLLRPRTASGKPRRAKSSMMPLERTPVSAQIRRLLQVVHMQPSDLVEDEGAGGAEASFFADDEWLSCFSGMSEGFCLDDAESLSPRLKNILVASGRADECLAENFEEVVTRALLADDDDEMLFDD